MAAKAMQLTLTGAGGYTTDLPKSNYIASADPTTAADDTAGYVSGSIWVNTTGGTVWACQSNATGAAVWIQLGPGVAGATGADGFPGGYTFRMTFRTGTGPSGSTGEFKYNNATVASVTALYSAKTDFSSSSLTDVLNNIARGDFIKLWRISDQTKWAVFQVTSSTDNTTYQTLAVTYVAANSTFADTNPIAFSICKAGPTGAIGGIVGTTPGVTSSTGLRTSGTPATISMATGSDDESGVITCTPGGAPATSALAFTVTFSAAYVNTPKAVILTPANAAAQALLDTGAFPYINDVDTTTALFKCYTGAVALTTGTGYRFHYKVCSAG
jgi:hypothetical protein